MVTHSTILAWKIPQRSLAGYSPWGYKESDTTERLTFSVPFTLKKAYMTIKLYNIPITPKNSLMLGPWVFSEISYFSHLFQK